MEASPLGFRVEASHEPRWQDARDATPTVDITVAQLASWVASALARGAVPGSAVGLEVQASRSFGAQFAQSESHMSLEDVCLCTMKVDRAQTSRMRTRILQAKRRFFNGRRFLLWVEDAPEKSAVYICACDEATWTRGHLEVDDTTLSETLGRIAYGRMGGLAAGLGLSTPFQGESFELPEPVEPFLGELLGIILDSVSFDVNRFGDEWSIRVPCLTSQHAALGCEEFPDESSNEPALRLARRRSTLGPSQLTFERVGAGPMPTSTFDGEAPRTLHHRHPLVRRLPSHEQPERRQSQASWRTGNLKLPIQPRRPSSARRASSGSCFSFRRTSTSCERPDQSYSRRSSTRRASSRRVSLISHRGSIHNIHD